MDGKEAMPFTQSDIHISPGGVPVQDFQPVESTCPVQPPSRITSDGAPTMSPSGSQVVESTFSVEPSSPREDDATKNTPLNGGENQSASLGLPSNKLVKRKRGRPRIVRFDGEEEGFSPTSATPLTPTTCSPAQKRSRGRPRGSKNKQQLPSLRSGKPMDINDEVMVSTSPCWLIRKTTESQADGKAISTIHCFHDLYSKIADRYGRLDKDLPTYLPQTYTALTKELLATISTMKHAELSKLTISDVNNWENIVKLAAEAKYNVGWLLEILAKMREFKTGNHVTTEMVEQEESNIENLKKKLALGREKLNEARQSVKVLEEEVSEVSSRLEDACLKLETLKHHQVSNFFADLD